VKLPRFARWVGRPEIGALVASLAATAVILALHYRTPPGAFDVHNLLRRLFYVPVVTAGIVAGVRGGLLTAVVASVAYLPHLLQLARAGQPPLDHALELILLLVIGGLVGGFADASRRARAAAAERGRLAALGEVGVGFIAQVEGPLAAVEGQVETLSFLADRDANLAMRTSVEMIRGEVRRARRFLLDLRDLARRTEGRVGTVNLSALLGGIVEDLAADPHSPLDAGLPVRLATLPSQALIRGSRATLAYSLRALLQGLLSFLPRSGHLAIALVADAHTVIMTLTADGGRSSLPDLRDALGTAFGPAPSDYKFKQALCLHLLAAEGVQIGVLRPSSTVAVVTLRFHSELRLATTLVHRQEPGRRRLERT
jgi:uncharacterized membrane protein (UPF0136 family)